MLIVHDGPHFIFIFPCFAGVLFSDARAHKNSPAVWGTWNFTLLQGEKTLLLQQYMALSSLP